MSRRLLELTVPQTRFTLAVVIVVRKSQSRGWHYGKRDLRWLDYNYTATESSEVHSFVIGDYCIFIGRELP